MKKIILITFFFSCFCFAQFQGFETTFTFADELSNSQELILGYNPFGTDGLDQQLGEIFVPQVPSGQFGVRFQLPTDTSLYTLKDIRFGCGQAFYYEYLFDLSYGGGSNINIDWEWVFELLAIHIIDGLNGQYITTLEAYFDPSEYQIPLGMQKIILGIQYNGPLSWPEYEVTSPNGGETLVGSEYYTITWQTNGIVPPDRLEYSTDAGNNWELISDSLRFVPNYYEWLVPYLSSNYCLIRIGDYPCAYDQSIGYFTITYPVTVENENKLPSEFSLEQNYPNPFNSSTTIAYGIPEDSFVSINVYDCLGNNVQTLVSEFQESGTYWIVFNVDNIPSGIYFLRLMVGEISQTKKMILLK